MKQEMNDANMFAILRGALNDQQYYEGLKYDTNQDTPYA